ncbi:MAG: DUF5666 domain-containing protein [Patescibacteria group bacterium]
MKTNIIFAVIFTLLVAGAGGFYGGMKYQQTKAPQNIGFMANGAAGGGRMLRTFNGEAGTGGAGSVGAMRANFANGQVLSLEGKTLTLKTQDGGSKIVFLTDATQIQKMDKAAPSDLANEKYVTITGTTNSDGSLTAATIQLRDAPPAQVQDKNALAPSQAGTQVK